MRAGMLSRTRRLALASIAAICSVAIVGASAAQAKMRYEQLDRNDPHSVKCWEAQVAFDTMKWALNQYEKYTLSQMREFVRTQTWAKKQYSDWHCEYRYGQIAYRSQWSGEPSVWAVKSFEAAQVVAGDFTSIGAADDVIAFAPSDLPGEPLDLHMAAKPLIPPSDGSPWGFEGSKITDYALYNLRANAGYDLTGEQDFEGVAALAGDFDGNGKDDIALTGGHDWHQVQVGFKASGASSGWSLPVPDPWVAPAGGTQTFPVMARQQGTKFVVGDFNGDGKADIAAMNTGWTAVQVARSASNPAIASSMGTFTSHGFTVSGQYGSLFTQWAGDAAVRMLAGDFNADGFDDLLLVGKSCWDLSGSGSGPCDAQVSPVAYGSASGFTAAVATNYSGGLNQAFGPNAGAVDVVAGDFNDDGRDDVYALWLLDVQPDLELDHPDKSFLPFLSTVSFASDSASFGLTTSLTEQILDAAIWPGAKLLAGDFNNDGKDDVAVVGRFNGRSGYGENTAQSGTAIAAVQTSGGGNPPQLIETPVTSPAQSGYGTNAPPELATVPSLTGRTLTEAVTALSQVGLVKGTVTELPGCTFVGKVAGQSVNAGAVVSAGSAVDITVHTQPASCTVPSVSGMELEDATDLLTGHGFVAGTVTMVLGTCVNAGSVAHTSPAAGSLNPFGSTVNIVTYRLPPGCGTE